MAVLKALVLLQVAIRMGVGEQSAPPVFGTRVDSVYVDGFVTRRGRPVAGLSASDFELRDDGVAQKLELLAADAAPLLAVLVFDTSASVKGDKLLALAEAGAAFVDTVRAADRVGLLSFQQEIQWTVTPTQDRESVRAALGRLEGGGATSLLDALYAAVVLPGVGTRSLIILFSDGQDTLSWLDESQVRQVVERSNAILHVVALRPQGVSVNSPVFGTSLAPPSEPHALRVLRQIAQASGGRLWWVEDPPHLRNAFAAIGAAMNARYVLRYEPEGVTHAGWHNIDVRLRGKKADVRTRRGYWAAPR